MDKEEKKKRRKLARELKERGEKLAEYDQIGRAHVWTPVTLLDLVCRLLLEKKIQTKIFCLEINWASHTKNKLIKIKPLHFMYKQKSSPKINASNITPLGFLKIFLSTQINRFWFPENRKIFPKEYENLSKASTGYINMFQTLFVLINNLQRHEFNN